MPKAIVRRPLYSGSQLVRALWFDCERDGQDVCRQRVLACWEPGARAYLVHNGYLLEWRAARRLRCEQLPGLPLCERGGLLASAPLHAEERAGLAPGHAVLVQGATLHAYPLDTHTRIDPSRWLDLSGVALRQPLAMPVQPSRGFVAAMADAPADVRSLLGDAVPPPSAQRTQFLRKVAAQASHNRANEASAGRTLLAGALAGTALLGGALGWLASMPFRSSGGAEGRGPARLRSPPTPMRDWITGKLAALAIVTRVSRAIGWRQASYLRKMLDQFERGDLSEALRNAIPLDARGDVRRQSFGTPGRRNSLDVNGPVGASSGIGIDLETTNHLRAVYRRSFEALDRAGRIDEAVFVLAELLQCFVEAVDYLEKNGRLRQAAQLSETLDLAPAVQVRLHLMAGDVERAILLARLGRCFDGAVADLERRRHPAAEQLRVHWAADLAGRGDASEAARVIWPVKQERPRAVAWLHQACAAGGTLGGRALVYRLALDPKAAADCIDMVDRLLHAEGEDAAQQRVHAAHFLIDLDAHNILTRRLAAGLWRSVAAERLAGLNTVGRDVLDKLLASAQDPVLKADQPTQRLPDAVAPKPLTARTTPLAVVLEDRGLQGIVEARPLSSGGYLLALGDAGVMQVDAHGRHLAFYPVPAAHLVIADNGQRALALARRESVVRVGRIDLASRKVDDWFSAPLDHWSPHFDGGSWSVVSNGRLMVLDAKDAGQSVLWKVDGFAGPIRHFADHGSREVFLVGLGDGAFEQWRYELPQRRLLQREQFRIGDEVALVAVDGSRDFPHEFGLATRDGELALALLRKNAQIELGKVGRPVTVAARAGMLLWTAAGAEGWAASISGEHGQLLARIGFPNAQRAAAVFHGQHVMAWDGCGRLAHIDTATGKVVTLTVG